MEITAGKPLLMAQTLFQTAVTCNQIWLAQWLTAKERGEKRLIPTMSMMTHAKIKHTSSKVIPWLTEQLSYVSLLFSSGLFNKILPFLPEIDQSKFAITSNKSMKFTKQYQQHQLTIFS